jgi:hypothetical protein
MREEKPQNPDYPLKRYNGMSTEEFIRTVRPSYCYECQRVHGLTRPQLETLLRMQVEGKTF